MSGTGSSLAGAVALPVAFFFFQAEDGIRDKLVTGVQTCALPICARAANRLVDILELLAASRDGLALREVSARLGAPKSSLLPLLRALTARGYLAQGRALEYRLGPGALDLGAAAPAHRDLVEVARPAGGDLLPRDGETGFLGTLCSDRASIVYLGKVESEHRIRDASRGGAR